MKRVMWLNLFVVVLLLSQLALAVGVGAQEPMKLRLATTTSTADSGLLDFILPDFEKMYNAKVEVIAVGTGQALELGRKGDADVVLVHDRKNEDKFVAEGYAKQRFDVMYNDFIIVGPQEDPAKSAGMTSSAEAFTAIANTKSPFASRGDNSGTHSKEKAIWASAGITPTTDSGWYFSLGQGMGETLLFANEKKAYTLTDRGTYLSMSDKLPNLTVMVGGNNLAENKDPLLLNPYGVMAVNPEKVPGVNYDGAMEFVYWITSVPTQEMIGGYGKDKYGQSLFYPDSGPYRAIHGAAVTGEPMKLRLATTTSTADSGLLDFILPDFEKMNNAKVDVVAVGTGQALELGRKGDADVVLVHDRNGEDKFVADGYAKQRFDVMYNDYIMVGPRRTQPSAPAWLGHGSLHRHRQHQVALRQPRRQESAPTPRSRPSGQRRHHPHDRDPAGTTRWARAWAKRCCSPTRRRPTR